jgi:ATP-dependent Zn protease
MLLCRFTDRVFVGLPNKAARVDILRVVLANEALAPDVDLARQVPGPLFAPKAACLNL